MRFLIAGTIALLLVSAPAYALRGVALGTDCDRVRKIEFELGSDVLGALPRESAADYRIFFKGRSHGRDAAVSYFCESGKATSQMIVIKTDAEHDGYAVFSDRHRELSAKFGSALKDLDEPSVANLEEALDHPTRRFAVWVVGERVINLTLWDGGHDGWEIVVTGP